MFNALSKNSTLYILHKTDKPVLNVGKVTEVKINPQFYGLSNQEVDITADVSGDTYDFKKIPATMSIVSPSSGIVISDNPEDMIKEYESMVANSQQILDSIDYHKSVIESRDDIMSILNPHYAREKEQESRLTSLEGKIGNMEQGISDIRSLLTQILSKKTQGGTNNVHD